MSEQMAVTIVDDKFDVRESLRQWLELSGYTPRTYESAEQALQDIDVDYPGIVISDLMLPGIDGLGFLRRIQMIDPQLPVIMITGYGRVKLAVEAMQLGAYDFLEKPFDPDRMADLAKRASQARSLTLENRALRRELSGIANLQNRLIGDSLAMRQLREEILDASQADGHVLITGEIGTGKSTIARALHACGPRQGKRFIVVNCDAFAEDELGRQLYGPLDEGLPLIDQSIGGSLCMEDFFALTPSVQARLLQRIEETKYRDRSPFRIIAVSNQQPEQESTASPIRQDLMDRIARVRIRVPQLRERPEDILPLFNQFTCMFSEDYGCLPPTITSEDAVLLLKSDFPGNVRQLIQVAERAVLSNRRGNFSLAELLSPGESSIQPTNPKGIGSLRQQLDAFEHMLIEFCMRQNHGLVAEVAKDLSIPRRTLNDKLVKYRLKRSDYQDRGAS